MPYLVYVKDKPDSLELRTELRPVHLAYLEANQEKLLAAGALLEDDGSVGAKSSRVSSCHRFSWATFLPKSLVVGWAIGLAANSCWGLACSGGRYSQF